MKKTFIVGTLWLLTELGQAQNPPQQKPVPPSEAAPRSDSGDDEQAVASPARGKSQSEAPPISREESSSRDTKIDLSPPPGDARDHPESVADPDDVQEFHNYDPHRAEKNLEVGDYYFQRKNYVAAESRYREALVYKPNDALATFRLAAALEQLGETSEALQNYRAYLKILPSGPNAKESEAALLRLQAGADATNHRDKEKKTGQPTSQLSKKFR